MAGIIPATRTDRTVPCEMLRRRVGAAWLLRTERGAIAALAAAVIALPCPASAANTVRITKLSDVAFGTIANLGVDTVRSQSVCIFSGTGTSGYNVRAIGSGIGNAFMLVNGTKTLAYEVQWNSNSGQTSGTNLSPNVAGTGLISTARNQSCASGPPTAASLIVVVRSAAASSATAGNYSGTLTLVFAPE